MNVEKKNFSNFPLGNKKGIFFTFAAIVLSIVIIFSFNVYTGYRLKDKMEVTEIRIDTMNNFIKDLENDIDNAILISGFRSLLSLEDYMLENDEFFDKTGGAAPKLDDAFEEVFRDGTITFGGSTEKMPLMDNNTFLNWTERMKVEANKIGIILDFTVNSITIGQTDPWMVDVTVRLDITVEDEKGVASWTINNKPYTRQINITSNEGETKFVDPLYLVKNGGLVNNTIRETIVDPSSSETYLDEHLLGSYYIEHSDAPSYLDRFEDTISGSNGIESLVNSQKLENGGAATHDDRSAVDYIYFGSQVGADCKVNKPTYDWFRLDTATHIDFYGAGCRGG